MAGRNRSCGRANWARTILTGSVALCLFFVLAIGPVSGACLLGLRCGADVSRHCESAAAFHAGAARTACCELEAATLQSRSPSKLESPAGSTVLQPTGLVSDSKAGVARAVSIAGRGSPTGRQRLALSAILRI